MALAVVTESNLEYFKGKQDIYNEAKFTTKTELQEAINNAVTTLFEWKGTKATASELPDTGNKVGDVWHVAEDSGEYAWNGSAWEPLGSIGDVDISWGSIAGKPASFPPSDHSHTLDDISDMPDWAKSASKPSYTADEVGAASATHTHANATASTPGFMSAEDKAKMATLQAVEAMTEGDIDAMFA